MSLACKELVELVTDYLEGTLSPEERARFDDHLLECGGCRNYIAQMKETIQLTGMLSEEDITPEAEDDLAVAKAWCNRQRAGLGDEFIEQVEKVLHRISNMPAVASEVYPGVRRVVLRRFPYGIFYRDDEDQVAVIAVYHSKRDPKGWQARA